MARPHWIIYPGFSPEKDIIDQARADYEAQTREQGKRPLSISRWLLAHVLRSIEQEQAS